MFLVKYAAALTSSNLNGSDLNVEAFSDYTGATEAVPVADGDYLMGIEVVSEELFGTIYLVHDGDTWEVINLSTTPGDLFIATSPDVQFQRGTMFSFLDTTNKVVLIGSQMAVAIAQAIAGA